MQPSECGVGNLKVEDLLLLASTIEAHLITFAQSVGSRTFQELRSSHEAHEMNFSCTTHHGVSAKSDLIDSNNREALGTLRGTVHNHTHPGGMKQRPHSLWKAAAQLKTWRRYQMCCITVQNGKTVAPKSRTAGTDRSIRTQVISNYQPEHPGVLVDIRID